MSLYQKAWLYTAWMVLVLVTFPMWMPMLEHLMGPSGYAIGIAIWVGHGMAALYLVTCPKCGLSVYLGGNSLITVRSPIPRRRCGECGRDHTIK
ncbi:hypothetical protein ACLBXM_16150 [Xanthobacteraceae bacterium A53D]